LLQSGKAGSFNKSLITKEGKMKKQITILNKGKNVQAVASMEACCKGVPSATK